MLVGLVLAVLAVTGAAGSAHAGPPAPPSAPPRPAPTRLSDLTPEQRSWRDSDGVISCSAHPTFPTCSTTPDAAGVRYPDDNSPFLVQMRGKTYTDLNPLHAVGDEVGSSVSTAFAQAAESIGKFAGDLLTQSMTWWIKQDSISLSYAQSMAGKEPVQQVVGLIMMAGILGSSIAMMISRRTQPAAEMVMYGVRYLLISSLALVVLTGAVHAGDDFARQMVTGGAEQFGQRMQSMLGVETIGNPGGVLMIGLIAVVLGFIQWVMGFMRQAGLVVLYAMILIAAAGQLSSWGRQWFPRVASMCIALVLYKPLAAFIYSLGFTLIGQDQSLTSLIVGLMVVAMAVIALPTLMKFFSFLGFQVTGGTGALGAAAGMIGSGALLASSLGGGGGGGGDPATPASFAAANGSGGQAEPDPSPGNTPQLTGGDGTAVNPPPQKELGGGEPAALENGSPSSAAAGAADAEMAAGAATGGVGLAAIRAQKAIAAAPEAAESVGDEMTGGDTGPDMP
ncbi:hypothetical protein [Nocardia vaccinii]|uniref:hypothetical protein n=1 Tax=Nocardia vaccinii TaxID=1822 RepID=UPI00082A098F|nr:hypothetical protein [Nocardia vaccinii]